ncbi:ubiquinol-cytochrome c reductase iron-sulfur subunit [Mesobacillus sp.]|uniref:QcrA and Rieske domain-containing protein n=1 Tax=Mesobacillus sp. TaxID=2675271 RepID=UPI0039F0C8A2
MLNRRKFLGKSLKGTAGILALSFMPAGLSACSKEESNIDTSSMAIIGPLNELEKGPFPKKVSYKVTVQDGWTEQNLEGFVYLNKTKENEFLIMSPVCTHLGCIAGEAEESKVTEGIEFYCPCHGGEYDEYGINIGGPPPRPLDVFEGFVKDNEVYIPILSPTKRTK